VIIARISRLTRPIIVLGVMSGALFWPAWGYGFIRLQEFLALAGWVESVGVAGSGIEESTDRGVDSV